MLMATVAPWGIATPERLTSIKTPQKCLPSHHHYSLVRYLILSRFRMRPRLRLGEAVEVHGAYAEFVRPGREVLQRHAPRGEAVAQRPFARLAGRGVEAPNVFRQHALG